MTLEAPHCENIVPRFKPGDICLCKNGYPGVVTHMVIVPATTGKYAKDTHIVYKGYHLTVETIGRGLLSPWQSSDPKRLLGLHSSYHRE